MTTPRAAHEHERIRRPSPLSECGSAVTLTLMRQEGLAWIEAANQCLATVYIPRHNARFAVAAAEEGTAFVPFVGALDDILCVQEQRVVGHDNTVRYAGRVLQIPEQRHRRHFVKVTVRVHAYPDGRL